MHKVTFSSFSSIKPLPISMDFINTSINISGISPKYELEVTLKYTSIRKPKLKCAPNPSSKRDYNMKLVK